MSDLIERLRVTRLLSQRNQYALQAEAADQLEAQQAEIARLREVLIKFARAADWWEAFHDYHRITTQEDGCCLEVRHLRLARKALEFER